MRSQVIIATTLACILSAVPTGCRSLPSENQPAAQAVAIENVINEVEQALANVQASLAAGELPPLKHVTLGLQTVASNKEGGSLKLWVVGFGSTLETGRTQEITITLVPPKAGGAVRAAGTALTADLEGAILSAAEGVRKAQTGPVPLELSALDVKLRFTVKRADNGSINLIVAPVTAGLDEKAALASTQTLEVSFALK